MTLHETPRFVENIADVSAVEWNRLNRKRNPFLTHEFLCALEQARCVGAGTGWTPKHLILPGKNGVLRGALPLYSKTHSWGEFVFDWSWAEAYEQLGKFYYPKLLSAIPFTPATGPRFLVNPDLDEETVATEILGLLRDLATTSDCSSSHVLFPTESETRLLRTQGYLIRRDTQFRWQNEDYRDFTDFLDRFTSAKRKKVRRERRRVCDAGVRFETLTGNEIDDDLWATIHDICAGTFYERGRPPYLNLEFFLVVAESMGKNIMVKLARIDEEPVAAAIFFHGGKTLYGRYWGTRKWLDSLHFETCYYQGIEFCIEHGLQTFEPGTQGEHKLTRGFAPVCTHSAHWFEDKRFHEAIANYLDREGDYVDRYKKMADDHLPFRE